MTRILNVGFIGAGKSAHRYQGPFVLRRPDKFRIKTLWARHIDNIPWDKYDAHYTTDLNELLDDPEIDLVVISTPVLHYEFTKQALEHGKNVLCEKPFTDTKEQAVELFNLAKEKGLFVMSVQNRRFDSDFLTTQKVIESGVLGDILEVEMHFDYYRPEVPESVTTFNPYHGYLYGHACHTIDQVLSYWGIPKDIHYDVRQLLGKGRMNDYFDIDLYYEGPLKVSVKSSYFRIKQRPRFVVYGKKGMFIKETEDRQEEHLKMFYMPTPDHPDFGQDLPQHYGTLTYMDDEGVYHEEKVPTVTGDYARLYDAVYDSIVNGAPKLVKDETTLKLMDILEEGIKGCE